MESANLHHQHHPLQDQLLVGSSPLATPSCYGVAGNTLSWTPNTILNPSSNFSPNSNGAIINSRNPRQPNDILVPSLINSTTSMIQDSSGFQWASSNNNNNNNAATFSSQSAAHDFHLERIKGELSDSYQKFAQMIHNSSSSSPSIIDDFQIQHTNYIKSEQGDHLNDLSEEKALLLRNFSTGCQISGFHHQLPAGDHFYSGGQNCSGLATPCRGNFSQIFPTINISNLNQSSSSAVPGSLDMNMQALDLFRHNVNLGVYKDCLSYGLDHHMQQSSQRLLNSPSKMSLFASGGATEAKRPSSFLEPKAAQKKSRSDSRASCPPFKVRKEKLGDRIAALQQLVAPFGKTDTASVLMEAIGYIKFLQNQVETLSVPYMKSSRNKTNRTMRGGSAAEDGNEERKRDLRSRGLCLVPLSCLSYVTDGGGGVWPPPNFGAGT